MSDPAVEELSKELQVRRKRRAHAPFLRACHPPRSARNLLTRWRALSLPSARTQDKLPAGDGAPSKNALKKASKKEAKGERVSGA